MASHDNKELALELVKNSIHCVNIIQKNKN
jgi:hypothetical protein